MYGCNSFSISSVMKASRFLVLKIRWIRMDDKDWGMLSSRSRYYFAPSALRSIEDISSWGDAPGYYISRPWRCIQNTLCGALSHIPNLILDVIGCYLSSQPGCFGAARQVIGDDGPAKPHGPAVGTISKEDAFQWVRCWAPLVHPMQSAVTGM